MALVECRECGNEISDEATLCIHCGMPEPNIRGREDDVSGLMNYESLPGAFRLVAALASAIAVAGIGLYLLFAESGCASRQESIPALIFFGYAALFASFWIIYFVSGKPAPGSPDWHKTRTLRRLLGETSLLWRPDHSSDAELEEIENAYRTKASSSMQVLAILIAVSVLEINMALDAFNIGISEMPAARQLAITLAGMFGFISFIFFVISVDAMDIVFNRFRSDSVRHRVIHYYYRITINPRYWGLVSMVAGLILLIAFQDFFYGCSAIAATLYFGFTHWFPLVHSGEKEHPFGPYHFWPKRVLMALMILPVALKFVPMQLCQ